MTTITTRSGKGSPLTNDEVDANFTGLNSDKAELSGANFTGSIDVTGTVTADGLTVDGATLLNNGTNSTHLTLTGTTNRGLTISTTNTGGQNDSGAIYDAQDTAGGGVGSHEFRVGGESKLLIAAGGDISFYEDTGTTAKLFWDASAESLGIGTSSIDLTSSGRTVVQVEGSSNALLNLTDGTSRLYLHQKGGTSGADIWNSADSYMRFATNDTERMRIDSSGNVGIGTSSPSYPFHLSGSGDTVAAVTAGASSVAALNLGNATNLADGGIRYDNSANALILRASNAERMRIDSSGNLLVGKSSSSFTTAGVELAQGGTAGKVQIQRSSSPLTLVNLTDDGNILNFYKGTATVGSIGSTDGTDLQIGSGNCYLRFDDATNQILPTNAAGAKRDAAFDLGDSDARFVDIYATNGTIQTSDRNEKQDIEELSDAEQRVAVACKGLLRKFRFKSSVEEKGDDARIHFGIIAQDLQDAFTAEGLDAGRYAMFISTTWTDEETGEERTRMGVRYSELLAFIIAAI